MSLRAISIGSFLFQLGVVGHLGLHPTDLHAVYALSRAPEGLSAGDLGAHLGLTTGSTTALLHRLDGRGFVARTTDETDRRRVVVSLTEQARTTLAEEYADIDARVVDAIGALTDAECDVVARFLQAVAEPR